MKIPLYLSIALGGAVGALSRYLIAAWVQNRTAGLFPWGTLTVNVVGCLLMGLLFRLFEDASVLRPEFRMAILVGVLGALTTFSTFSNETLQLLNDGQVGWAAANVLGTNAACLLAVWIGYRTAQLWA